VSGVRAPIDLRSSMVRIMALGVALAGAVGAAFWFDRGGDAVSIPEAVCQKKIPSEGLEVLLPGAGKAFKEERSYGFTSGAAVSPDGLTDGRCSVSAGGESVDLYFGRIVRQHADADLSESAVRDSASAERSVNEPW
jgi:hypothetical protein